MSSSGKIRRLGCREIGHQRTSQRWIIHDNSSPEAYWTGEGWSTVLKDAKLFQDRNVVFPIAKRLQDAILKHLPLKTYAAMITVEVRSEQPLSLEELKDYCHGASSFEFDYDLYGTGPNENSQVWATIKWDSLKKRKG